MQRNKIYKLSELNIGDRFTIIGGNGDIYQLAENGVVLAKVVDSKLPGANLEEFTKKLKECNVRFLRSVK